MSSNGNSVAQKWMYQDQEFTDDLGYNMYEYKWRHYDPTVGRFFAIDPLARDFPQWGPYTFSGNFVIVARELEGLEPEFLISQGGKVTSPMVTLLNAAYGYSISSLTNTNWIPYTDPRAGFWDDIVSIPESTSASVRGKTVIHDDNQKRSDKAWFKLIAHEQSHREDVENVGNIAFYRDYLAEGAQKEYRSIRTENKAFKNGDYANELLNYDNGSAMKVLSNKKLSDSDKSSQLESIGARFKRDVVLKDRIKSGNKIIGDLFKEINSLGSGSKDEGLKSALKNLVNLLKELNKKNEEEQDEITKKYGQ